jgi:hypothetical protein
MALPHGRDGLSARRMAVLWTCREPSLCRYVRREFMRNAWLDCTPIIPATSRTKEMTSRHTVGIGEPSRCTDLCGSQDVSGACSQALKYHVRSSAAGPTDVSAEGSQLDHGYYLAPVEPAPKADQGEAGSIGGPPRFAVAFLIQCQWLTEKEVRRGQSGVQA